MGNLAEAKIGMKGKADFEGEKLMEEHKKKLFQQVFKVFNITQLTLCSPTSSPSSGCNFLTLSNSPFNLYPSKVGLLGSHITPP